jgi:hypothetical protein
MTTALPPDWNFYFIHVNGELASIRFDASARTHAPIEERPWLLHVWLPFRSPGPQGLSSREEYPRLSEIEAELVSTLAASCDGAFVGTITTQGRREFCFYARTAAGLDDAVSAVLTAFPEYSADTGSQRDESWAHYRDALYPSPESWQCIRDRDVIDALERSGDRHDIARPVSHWAYFPTAQARDTFHARVRELGFARVDMAPDEPAASKFGIHFERTGTIDGRAIEALTRTLFRAATELGGEYDGWETSVERGEA